MLTTQLFFDEAVNTAVYKREPYSQKTGRDVFNDDDNIFDAALVTTTSKQGEGYLALMNFDVEA